MRAVVYKSTGSWYTVRDDSGKFWNARMKGIFKIDDITSTNPVAVGDIVEVAPEDSQKDSFQAFGEAGGGEGNTVVITKIYDRRNYINRQSPRAKHQHHIVAANVDQSVLLATLKEPRTSQGFIDRFLVASEMYHVSPLIVFNKTDLYENKENRKLSFFKEMYERIGYPVYPISAKKKEGVQELYGVLKNKITLISGHSGVGKSSLLNVIIKGLNVRTQDVSGWSGKGLHTTTFAEMYDLEGGGKIIDTPGMREFGLVNITRQELSHYFPEMRDRLNECQFNNCLHINEPGCKVKEAVMNGGISEERYISYMNILDSIAGKQY